MVPPSMAAFAAASLVSLSAVLPTPAAATTDAAEPQPSVAGRVYDVSTVAGDDAWAVGTYRGESRGPLAAHWDGRSWTTVAMPEIDADTVAFASVSALATDDVWAVGYYHDSQDLHALVEHWDGSAWARVPAPDYQGSPTLLFSVSALASDDVWAVGDTDSEQGVAERWDGTSWTVSALPGSYVRDVDALSSKDVWVATEESGILHWNGKKWTSSDGGSNHYSISAAAGDDAWAVGRLSSGIGSADHWDGTAWAATTFPGSSDPSELLLAVSARSHSDAWVVGQRHIDGRYRMFAMHWDGSSWKQIRTPHLTGSVLLGVDAFAADDAWAVGQFSGHDAGVIHWDGNRWSTYPIH